MQKYDFPRIPEQPDLPPLMPPPGPPSGGKPPVPAPPYRHPRWQYGEDFWGQNRDYWEDNPGFLIERMLQELAPNASMDVKDWMRERLWTGYNAWKMFGTVQTAIGRGAEERAPLGDVLQGFMGRGWTPWGGQGGNEQGWARNIGNLLFQNRTNPVVSTYLENLNKADPEGATRLAAYAGGLPSWMRDQLARSAPTLRQQYGGQGAPTYLDWLWRRLVR